MLSASVIGCGRGGTLSLDALQGSSLYRPVAAADPSKHAQDTVRERLPELRLFDDFREMLAACPADVVCVATPAPTHDPIARDVLEHGVRGLLLEKPLACDVATAEALLSEIDTANLPLVVPHGMLVLPAPQEIKKRVRRGDIGRLISIEIQSAVDLLNAGIHWLVYLLDTLADDRPAAVEAEFDVGAHAINDGVQIEAGGRTCIEMQSGISIVVHSGKQTVPKSEVLPSEEQLGALFRLSGSDGVIEFSAWAGSFWIQSGKSHGEFIRRPLATGRSYHQVFLEQLAQNIVAGVVDHSSAELSLAALRLIETAYRAHDEGDWQLGVPASAG